MFLAANYYIKQVNMEALWVGGGGLKPSLLGLLFPYSDRGCAPSVTQLAVVVAPFSYLCLHFRNSLSTLSPALPWPICPRRLPPSTQAPGPSDDHCLLSILSRELSSPSPQAGLF